MRTKVFALCAMVVLLLASMPMMKSAGKIRVLYDRTHDEHFAWTEKSYLTDQQIKSILDANGFDVTIYSKGNLNYELLQDYDALIICVPRKVFTKTEVDDIVNFVKNGGGLYLLGTRSSRFYGVGGIEEMLNPLSKEFGVTYTTVNNITVARPIDVKSSHEVIIGVKQLRFEDWTTLTVKSPAEILLTVDGFGMFAYDLMGFGKAFFSADDAPLTLNVLDNEKLSVNVLNWISTYGGPYRNYQKKLASANSVFGAAEKLYNEGNLEKARDAFSLAKGRYESLTAFYKTGEHVGKMAQCDTYIKKIDDELNREKQISSAKNMLATGKSLFDAGEYLQAQQILQTARDAFQNLNMTNEYAQTQDMLSKIEDELKNQEEEKAKQEEEKAKQEEEKAKQDAATKKMYTYIGIGIALLVLMVVAILILTRGRKPKRREFVEERKSITRKYMK